jgi:hypothetical protein
MCDWNVVCIWMKSEHYDTVHHPLHSSQKLSPYVAQHVVARVQYKQYRGVSHRGVTDMLKRDANTECSIHTAYSAHLTATDTTV